MTEAAKPLPKRNEKGQRLFYPAEEVQAAFDALKFRYDLSEVQVWRGAYAALPPGEQLRFWCRFLRDVRTCPPRVMRHAEQLLAERHAAELALSPEPSLLETPQPDPIVVTREPSTYRGRVPHRTPHPELFGGLPDFAPVKSS